MRHWIESTGYSNMGWEVKVEPGSEAEKLLQSLEKQRDKDIQELQRIIAEDSRVRMDAKVVVQ